MQSPRRSLFISFLTQYSEMAIHFVGVMILARLLTPEDTGAFSIAACLLALLHVLRDFGVGQYIIQERELSNEKIRDAMGVAIILAGIASGTLLLLSAWVAQFYQTPVIEQLLWVMAASFAISPLGSTLQAIYRREFMLRQIFYIKTFSALGHVTVAIFLAWRGYGALSLVWANFCGILFFGLAANVFRPQGLPWLPRFHSMGAVLRYGSVASIGNGLSMAGGNVSDVVIGKVMDIASVGFFSRAKGLVDMFAKLIGNAVLPVMLPLFAQAGRDGVNLGDYYLRSVSYMVVVAWPFFITLSLLAYPVVRVLYGPQWDASVPMVKWLCLAGCLSVITTLSHQVFMSSGFIKTATGLQMVTQPVRIILVVGAAFYSLETVAQVLAVWELLALLLTTLFLCRRINLKMGAFLAVLGKNMLVSCSSAILPLLTIYSLGNAAALQWLTLLLGGLGAILGWLLGIFMTKHRVAVDVRHFFSLVVRRIT